MFQRTSEERGWVLVTAVSLMTIMLIVALASVALVDTQQKRSRQQRESESSLNLAEAVLYAQGFKMAQSWPTAAKPAVDCSSTAPTASCPVPADVQRQINNIDTIAGTTWTTRIRDNGGNLAVAFQPAFADQAQSGTRVDNGAPYSCTAPCRYDANGDRKVWVESRAIGRGRLRTIVATLKLERLPESTPRTAVVAGGINTGNNGSQVKIYAVGSGVVVRCDPKSGTSCVSGTGIEPAAAKGNPPPMMSPPQIERFRQRAIADGRYYAGCPTTWDLRGEVVFVDNCVSPNLSNGKLVTNACPNPPGLPIKPGGGGNGMQDPCINTIDRPGLLIWHCGSIDFSGKATYVGVMYFPNGSDKPDSGPCSGVAPRGTTPINCSAQNSPNNVFHSTGGFGIWGAIAIDGNGCLHASANGLQVFFDPNVFDAVASYGTVGLVQDTWRELAPS
jgi:type II secretory pathway pseudopilin PulG